MNKRFEEKVHEEGEVVLNIENALLDTLIPFQLEGIKFVIKHGGIYYIHIL
jgi:hypothetical protein